MVLLIICILFMVILGGYIGLIIYESEEYCHYWRWGMNRAERRRVEKAKAKVHVMTRSEEIFERGYQQGIKEGLLRESGMTTRLFTTAMAAVLHDEFGFGKTRLERVLEHVAATLQDIEEDLDRERRIRNWIKGKTDIDLDDYTGGRSMEVKEEIQKMHDLGTFITSNDMKLANGIVGELVQ